MEKTDNAQFACEGDLDNSEPDDSFYSVGENISKQPEKKGNDSQYLEQDITDFDDLESELSDALKKPLEINSGSIEISGQ